jgi:hypothetical protein
MAPILRRLRGLGLLLLAFGPPVADASAPAPATAPDALPLPVALVAAEPAPEPPTAPATISVRDLPAVAEAAPEAAPVAAADAEAAPPSAPVADPGSVGVADTLGELRHDAERQVSQYCAQLWGDENVLLPTKKEWVFYAEDWASRGRLDFAGGELLAQALLDPGVDEATVLQSLRTIVAEAVGDSRGDMAAHDLVIRYARQLADARGLAFRPFKPAFWKAARFSAGTRKAASSSGGVAAVAGASTRWCASRAIAESRVKTCVAASAAARRAVRATSRACFFAARNAAPEIAGASAGTLVAGERSAGNTRTPHSSAPAILFIVRSIAALRALMSAAAFSRLENIVKSFKGMTVWVDCFAKCSTTASWPRAMRPTRSRSTRACSRPGPV